ncbi:MAG: protoporphyrinogen oxidase [Fimbriimonas sp.]
MPKRVAIVGGGITGLAAAYELERRLDVEIDLYEASEGLGGKLRTDRIGDLLVEGGPDCFFAQKPGVLELVRELGLEEEIVEPLEKEFSMLVGGRLHRVPRGLVTLNDLCPEAVAEATFLSEAGKARALTEREQPVGTGEDESIRAFFDRRFGPEFTRLVVEPLLAGTHGGDADRLSMEALYPGYRESERRHGSLVGFRAPSRSAKPTFLAFRGGMQTLVDALARALTRTRIHLKTAIAALPPADHVLVALPANRAACLLPGLGLEGIPHRSSVIATYAFRREDVGHPCEGTGFLVPPMETFPLTGATWSSEKWPGRAPEGTILVRAFMREGTDAVDALRPLLGLQGEPTFRRADVWTEALPQYEVGHRAKIAAIEAALPKTVSLAGTSYRGVGVPDCLRQGREAAARIAESL